MSAGLIALAGQGVLTVFFAFFTGVLVWAWRMPALQVEAMRHLPLGADDEPRAPQPTPTCSTEPSTSSIGGERHA